MLKNLLTLRVLVSLLLMAVLATAANAGILTDHFGVTPLLDLTDGRSDGLQGGATSYHFVPGSLTPTLHTSTTDYTVDDWYGSWSNTALDSYTDWTYTGQSGGLHPSGEEPYDVEAIYFDNDATNLYVAVVTSFGPIPGFIETRYQNLLVICGDLALDLGSRGSHNGAYSADGFEYDYGVDIVNDGHPASGNASATGSGDNELYQTYNGDWYVGTSVNAVGANGELTNFDPGWTSSTCTSLGDTTVSYEKLTFMNGAVEVQECLSDTYVIEITISRSLLPTLYDGDSIGIGWVEGCRNDAPDSSHAVIRLTGDIDVPEPATMFLLAIGGVALLRRKRRRRVGSNFVK